MNLSIRWIYKTCNWECVESPTSVRNEKHYKLININNILLVRGLMGTTKQKLWVCLITVFENSFLF